MGEIPTTDAPHLATNRPPPATDLDSPYWLDMEI